MLATGKEVNMGELILKALTIEHLEEIVYLTHQLNPAMERTMLKEHQTAMFAFNNYTCFGVFKNNKLIGLCSGWLTVRIYSGKQLEIDNVIIDASMQSKGFGKKFLALLEDWAKINNCNTVELNTYLQNSGSHKFYFNQGYRILGFHFQKQFKMIINYNNRKFRPVSNTPNGETSGKTIFTYQQKGNILTSEYAGGKIKKGHLIGLVDENGNIEMRYHQINFNNELMTGICFSQPEFHGKR